MYSSAGSCSLFALVLPPCNNNYAWQAGNVVEWLSQKTHTHAHTDIALPAIFALWRIRTALSALLLSSMFLSCHARISVIHIKVNIYASCHITRFPPPFSAFRKWNERSPSGQSVDCTTLTSSKCYRRHPYRKVNTIFTMISLLDHLVTMQNSDEEY